jgi:release factor glutamine methyltransferase
VGFNGLALATRPGRVMTPRSTTEQLVAAAVERLDSGPARVVDVGTGAGGIAIAIAAAAPNVEVFATDTSRCAVALARANVRRHGLRDRVTVCHGDLLEPVPDPIDLVVANLPYLPAALADRYPDLANEPPTAVFAPGDGLESYRLLLSACAERIDDNAAVVIQLHRRVLSATGADLPALGARLERSAAAHAAELDRQATRISYPLASEIAGIA